MKKIFQIHKRDLGRIGKNAMALIVVVGVCVLPALYAWFNIAANWDPYGKTNGIKVAVVNNDSGASLEGLQINIGKEIVDNLRENTQIGWQFVAEDDAQDGVRSGDYYAAVIIPQDFTEKMSSILTDNIEAPTIDYYINEKKNAIAPKITDKGIDVLQQQVNSTFISAATEAIANILNVAVNDVEQNDQNFMKNVLGNLTKVSNGLADFETTVDLFIATTNSLSSLSDTSQLLVTQGQQLAADGGQAVKSMDTAITSFRLLSGQIVNSVGDVVDDSLALVTSLQHTTNKALNALGAGEKIAVDWAEDGRAVADKIIQQNNSVITAVNNFATLFPATKQVTDNLLNLLTASNKNQQKLTVALSTVINEYRTNGSVSEATEQEVNNLLADTVHSLTVANNTYKDSLRPLLTMSVDDLLLSLSSVSALLNTTGSTVATTGQVLDGLNNSLLAATNALTQSKTLISNSRASLENLITELNSVGDNEKITKLIEILRNDPILMGDFMSSPVQIDTHTLYGIANYGSAMTPFYSSLAFWVGGIVLVAILKVRVDEDQKIKNIKPHEAYLGRYLLFLLLGLFQATVICLGDLFFLKVQCLHPWLFILAGLISSLVYTMIIYTLTVSFGDIGKALAVIFLVIQIAGAGGTFPIEVTPTFFQHVYPFLPFTYSLNAMRETIAGTYAWDYWQDLFCLCLFIPVSLLLGLVLRKPLLSLNRFFEDRLDDTKLM